MGFCRLHKEAKKLSSYVVGVLFYTVFFLITLSQVLHCKYYSGNTWNTFTGIYDNWEIQILVSC